MSEKESPMPDRAERRRAEREQRRPEIFVGEGIVATTVPGAGYEARPHAKLPPKVPGGHRWIAIASYVVNLEQVRAAMDPDIPKYLDRENLFMISIGCYDCELPLGAIKVDSVCPAPAAPE
jgi:hypothetical protein